MINNQSRKSKSQKKKDEIKELQDSDDECSKKQILQSMKFDNQVEDDLENFKIPINFKPSPFLSIYVRQLVKGRIKIKSQDFTMKFNKHKIVYLADFKVPLTFQISKVYESRNKKIMYFQVRFSQFIIHIKILNICPKDNINLQLKNWISSGVYGSVYQVDINNVKYAIKKMPLNNYSKFKDITNAIEQYCIMKLCSALQIGPAYGSVFGFDLIVTSESIFFSCEMGLSIYQYAKCISNTQQDFEANFYKLEESLILLHSFGIIHNDIKPNNIIYSPKNKKFCFIDFGLSEVIQNPVGSLKRVKPRGSISYCSQEMKQLFFNDFSQGQIDLYYNDMISLQKSKQSFKGLFNLFQKQEIENQKNHQLLNYNINLKEQQHDYFYQQKIKSSNKNDSNGEDLDEINEQDRQISEQQFRQDSRQSEMQVLMVIRLIFCIEEKSIEQIQQLVRKNFFKMSKIISTNLKTISFVFFESGKNPALYNLYQKIMSYVSKSDTITDQTVEVIQCRLEPYFRSCVNNQGESNSLIIGKYLQQQRQSRQIICSRYEEKQTLFFNNEIIVRNQSETNEQLSGCFKQIKIFLPLASKNDLQPVIKQILHFITQIGTPFLIETIRYHIAKIDFFRVWTQITQAELMHFQIILNKLALKITFQSKVNPNQEKFICPSDKYIVYLQIFLQLYFIKTQQYRINAMIGRTIQIQIMQAQTNITNYQCFKDLYQVENQSKQDSKNVENEDVINYFRYATAGDFEVFQLCLNIIDRLIKTLDGFLPYSSHIQNNNIFADILETKIRSCLLICMILEKYIRKQNPQSNIFLSASLLTEILLSKCIEFRRRTICEKLSKAQDFNDFVRIIQSYESLYNIWDKMNFNQEPLKSEIETFRVKMYLDVLSKKVLQKSQNWYKIQKQLFEVIIYTMLIPFQEYEKFNLLKKYYEIFRKENSRIDKEMTRSYAQYYAVSKTFKLALQLDDFNTIIKIFQYVECTKTYVLNPRYSYSVYYFYKKCNNSKKIAQCKKLMETFKKSNSDEVITHVEFQNRVSKIAMQIPQIEKPLLEQLNLSYSDKYQKQQKILKDCVQQKQEQYHNFISSLQHQQPSIKRICQEFLKQWEMQKRGQINENQLQTRLFNLRFILKRVFYSSKNLSFLFSYLSKDYEIQIQKYESLLFKKINYIKERKKVKSEIWKFFSEGCLSEDQYWEKVRISTILLIRSKLLTEITKNFDVIWQHQVNMMLKQWKHFDTEMKRVFGVKLDSKQTIMSQKNSSVLPYYDLKVKIDRVIYLNAISTYKSTISSNKTKNKDIEIQKAIINKKITYIYSFIEHLKRAIIKYEKLSNKMYSPDVEFKFYQTQNIMNYTTSHTFRSGEPYVNMLTDCFQGNINVSDLQDQLKKHKMFKNYFDQKFVTEDELKKSFYEIVQSRGMHMFFYLYQFRIIFMQNLIQLGTKLIVEGKIQDEINCYFLTFMFYHICQFVKKFNCSSYSYLIIGMINSFQQKLLSLSLKSQQHKEQKNQFNHFISQPSKENLKYFQAQSDQSKFIEKLRLITSFQETIIKFLIEEAKQSKIQHSVLILLACQRVKFQIILFLIKNKLIKPQKIQQSCPLDNELALIRKIQLVVCQNSDALEYLARIFLKHTLYCYLVMLKLSEKMFNMSENKLTEWLAFMKPRNKIKIQINNINEKISSNRKKLQHQNNNKIDSNNQSMLKNKESNNHEQDIFRKLQIKHFRSARRVSKENQKRTQKRRLIFTLEEKYYYLIFQPIKQESLKKMLIIGNKSWVQRDNNNNKKNDSFTYVKAMNKIEKKIDRYLEISCSNELV